MRSLVAHGLCAAWLWALALAASPALHEWAHHDAGHADHECLATAIAHGFADDAVPPVLTAPALVVEARLLSRPASVRLESIAVAAAAWPQAPPVTR